MLDQLVCEQEAGKGRASNPNTKRKPYYKNMTLDSLQVQAFKSGTTFSKNGEKILGLILLEACNILGMQDDIDSPSAELTDDEAVRIWHEALKGAQDFIKDEMDTILKNDELELGNIL